MTEEHQELNIDEIIKALPLHEKIPVVALKKLHDQREAIDEEQEQKIQEIKKKYYEKMKPLLSRASQIIKGAALKNEEVAGIEQYMKVGEKLSDFMKGKSIDGYWNGVLSNSAIVDQINEKDQLALQYLLDMQEVDNSGQGPEIIQIIFTFKPNPYFNEAIIRRKVICQEGIPICIQGDKITWKQNQCLTHELRKVTNKKTGQKSTTLGKKIKSFFDIFLDWDIKSQETLDYCAGIMSELYNLIVSNHIDYFLGVVNADDQSDQQILHEDEDDDEEK